MLVSRRVPRGLGHTETRRKTFTVAETQETRPLNADDQIVVGGVLTNGIVVSAHYRGGVSRGTNLLWEINGTAGDLQITAASGHIQLSELSVLGGQGEDTSLSVMEIPPKYRTVPTELGGPVVAVAEAYARFADGLSAVDQIPDFDAGVNRHRLLDAIERSCATAERIAL